jgi:hypothetical protein
VSHRKGTIAGFASPSGNLANEARSEENLNESLSFIVLILQEEVRVVKNREDPYDA